MALNPNLEDPRGVAALIDHTLLKPEATTGDISRLCAEAREYRFASVCVNPHWVALAAAALTGASVRVCTVIGFPLGANLTRVKLAEAEAALSQGATELDMVQNIGALRSGVPELVRDEIRELAILAHSNRAMLKVILETCLLTDDQKVRTCTLALEAGADFVKTSTGFSTAGATVADVKLMRRTVDSKAGVKASGGVRTLDVLRQMVRAGATRIGSSSGVSIVQELTGRIEAGIEGRGETGSGAAY